MAAKTFSSITSSNSFKKRNIDEKEWVERMRKSVVEHEEEIDKVPICIFTVPHVLLATDPESYIPQQIALGPFHHWREEVSDMERYKLAAARRTQKHMDISFERIVESMKKKDEARIRACYQKSFDMSGDALIWMMAVDMAFLLEFLQLYFMKEERRESKTATSSTSHSVKVSREKLSHMTILRDLVMVENQIPLFLIKTMLEHQSKKFNHEKPPEETLKLMLRGLYHELSPFHEKELPDVDINDCDHLLDFLYHMTVPNNKEHGPMEAEIHIEEEAITEISNRDEEETVPNEEDLNRVACYIWKILSTSNFFKKIISGRPMALLMKLPILKLLKEPMERMLQRCQGKGVENSEVDDDEPTIEEITIPSVTEMAYAGIILSPVNGGISDISFDHITSTLYLPVINLNVNSEVYLRNLVAYEACVAAGPLVVARYTELMNGIIDTEEDAKYLEERGIVVNHLKSEKEVADLWNGMSKSVKLTKVAKMDKVIEDVNKMYGRTWRVKMETFFNTYVIGSWKFLTVLATLFILLLTGLQTFCSVYSCPRVFHELPDIQGEGPI